MYTSPDLNQYIAHILMQLTFLHLIIAALATYRITRIVLLEDGPFDLVLKLRGVLDPDARTWLGKGMRCVWCVSFWVGPGVVCAATYTTGLLIVSGLACSALTSLGMTYGPAIYDLWRRRKP